MAQHSINHPKTRPPSPLRQAWAGMMRTVKYRLIIPIMRGHHDPHYTARGVAVGVAVAMTPTIGIQMLIVTAIWLMVRKFPSLNFNVIVGMAWTWLTNVFTAIPVYYLFFLTGQILRGHPDDLTGFSAFADQFNAAIDHDLPWLEMVWRYTMGLIEGWGLSMLIGSIPWSLFSAWIGYVATLRFLARHRARRHKRAGRKKRRNRSPNSGT